MQEYACLDVWDGGNGQFFVEFGRNFVVAYQQVLEQPVVNGKETACEWIQNWEARAVHHCAKHEGDVTRIHIVTAELLSCVPLLKFLLRNTFGIDRVSLFIV